MATTKREGKERRGPSPPSPAPSGKVPAADAARSSSSRDREASTRPKRSYHKPTANPTPDPCKSGKKTVPQAPTIDGGRRLTTNKSMERPPSAPRPSRGRALDGVKNVALRSSSSLPGGVVVVAARPATSPTPKQRVIPAAAASSPRPKPGGVPAVAATSSRPRSGAAVAKPKADRPAKPQGRVPTPPARGKDASKHTVMKDAGSRSRSGPTAQTKPEGAEMVAAPVAKVDEKAEQQCLVDSAQHEDGPMPDLPDPGREIKVIANADEERNPRTEVDVGHREPEEQRPEDRRKGDEAAKSVVREEKPVAGRRQGKEMLAYNDVIEQTRSKLVGKRKGKVLALVGAFETVISLQEPETPAPVQAPAQVNQPGDNTTVAVATTSLVDIVSATAAPGRREAERDDRAVEPIGTTAIDGVNDPVAATTSHGAHQPIAATATDGAKEPIAASAT